MPNFCAKKLPCRGKSMSKFMSKSKSKLLFWIPTLLVLSSIIPACKLRTTSSRTTSPGTTSSLINEKNPEVFTDAARGPGTPYAVPYTDERFVSLFTLSTTYSSPMMGLVVKSDRGFYNPDLGGALNSKTGGRIFNIDITLDRLKDVVMLNPSGRILVLENKGNLAFGGPGGGYATWFDDSTYATDFSAGSSSRIFVGQFSGDSQPDILIMRANGALQVLVAGDGTFTAASPTIFTDLASKFRATSTSYTFTGNFIGDSREELVITSPDTGSIYIFSADANGVFSAPKSGTSTVAAFNFAAWAAPMSNTSAANWLVGDFNGDSNGQKELMFTWTDGSVWSGRVTGTPTQPTMAWSQFVSVPTQWSPSSLTKTAKGWLGVMDANVDGKDDLVYAATNGSLWVFHSSGSESPSSSGPINYFNDTAMAPNFNSGDSVRFLVGNFDGDEGKRPDLMILNGDGDFKILTNTGSAFSWLVNAANWYSKPEWGASHIPVKSSAFFFVDDLNRDGMSDLVVIGGNGEIVTLKAMNPMSDRPDLTGQWSPIIEDKNNEKAPYVPAAAMAVLPNGKIWMIGTSLTDWPANMNQFVSTTFLNSGRIWDLGDWSSPTNPFPTFGSVLNLAMHAENIFCGAHAFSPNGQLVNISGLFRTQNVTLFDQNFPMEWKNAAVMANGRYYPTLTPLPNGKMLATSGSYYKPGFVGVELFNKIAEILTFTGSSTVDIAQTPIGNQQNVFIPMWPNIFVAPDGRIFKAGPDTSSRYFDTTTGIWTAPVAESSRYRFNGPAVEYGKGKILMVGGANAPDEEMVFMPNGDITYKGLQDYAPGTNFPEGADEPLIIWYKNRITASAEAIDLNAGKPTWRSLPEMTSARFRSYATVLPDGKILVTGGTAKNTETSSAIFPELFDPSTESWSIMAPMSSPRLYHSAAMLLPDARILVAGSSEPALTPGALNQPTFQFYKPKYLFKKSGNTSVPAERPDIANAPEEISHGQTFTITMASDATAIRKLTWIRLPSLTHSWNPNQRFIPVESFNVSGNSISITAPADGIAAQPGHYMLFALDLDGVPSVAKIIRIKPVVGDIPVTKPAVPPAGSSLYVGNTLASGQALYGNGQGTNCSFMAAMQPDGNLVVYRGAVALWNSKTNGNPGAKATLQIDGNFVIYKANGGPVFSSGTIFPKGATRLTMQGDGNLVLYGYDGVAVWFTKTTVPGCLNQGAVVPVTPVTPVPTPSVTPAPGEKAAAGLFSFNGGIYYSNGGDAFCVFTSPGHLTACGMAGKPSTIRNSLPGGMRNDGPCSCASKFSEGMFQIAGAVFYSNGNDAYCGLISPEHLKSCGMAGRKITTKDYRPHSMRFDDGCACGINKPAPVAPSPTAVPTPSPTLPPLPSVSPRSKATKFIKQRAGSSLGAPIAGSEWASIDVNGDKKTDLIRYWSDGGLLSVDGYISDGNTVTPIRMMTKQGSFATGQKIFWGDFNGDGKFEMATYVNDGGSFSLDVYLSNGNTFAKTRMLTKYAPWAASHWNNGDFNGDGKMDIARWWADAGHFTVDVLISNGTQLTPQRWATKQGGFFDAMTWHVGDFNGDGKTDLIKHWNDGGMFTADAHLSTGQAFNMVRFATKQGGYWVGMQWQPGDFNGDGKDDLIKQFNDNGSTSIDIHPSNGNSLGIVRAVTKAIPFLSDVALYPLDFDGDGITDIARPFNDAGMFSISVFTSSSGSIMNASTWGNKLGFFTPPPLTHRGDFNGDKRSDLIKIVTEGGQIQIDFIMAAP